jgi:hypothetical protein
LGSPKTAAEDAATENHQISNNLPKSQFKSQLIIVPKSIAVLLAFFPLPLPNDKRRISATRCEVRANCVEVLASSSNVFLRYHLMEGEWNVNRII